MAAGKRSGTFQAKGAPRKVPGDVNRTVLGRHWVRDSVRWGMKQEQGLEL